MWLSLGASSRPGDVERWFQARYGASNIRENLPWKNNKLGRLACRRSDKSTGLIEVAVDVGGLETRL